MSSTLLTHNLGYPRMGDNRQLKRSLEEFWSGAVNEEALQKTAQSLRQRHWEQQAKTPVDLIPSNDFSFYDQMLDTSALVGAVPERFGWKGGEIGLSTYFAMARGKEGVPAMEMTKWFDTNYHYIVPEFHQGQTFKLSSSKAVREFNEAKALGHKTKPVFIGPFTFLKLGKIKDEGKFNRYDLLKPITAVYIEVLKQLAAEGAEWVELDEPAFSLDLTSDERKVLAAVYEEIAKAVPPLNLLVANYFGHLNGNLETFLALPVKALHIDLFNGEKELDTILSKLPASKSLSIGIVEGRNIWKNDYAKSVQWAQKTIGALGENRVFLAPSCSLLHSPVSLRFEKKLDAEIKDWLAFADEKLVELVEIRTILQGDETPLAANQASMEKRRKSSAIHRPSVQDKVKAVQAGDYQRPEVFEVRKKKQQDKLHLPDFPTTTIGSFPQTKEIREKRASFRKGTLQWADYEAFLKEETQKAIAWQEKIGIDVLVHGEFERNDMVEYFGEKLMGFTFTENGWVQSYGSRCVKPPVIYGDVHRAVPMTLHFSQFAQSLTKKPVKGMLTGPITILQWSFVRNDQPRSETAKQLALAIRDEVKDLEDAGISVIQVDEPALREGLPLRHSEWADYLKWSVDAFRLATGVAKSETQIHTHMCYCEFNDIIDSIAALDADVISIESSRSDMDILEAFKAFKYPNDVGPGVYDIHSPRVPSESEMETLAHKALERLRPAQFWVNPDCGLKTRGWVEVEKSLVNMVQTAKKLRQEAVVKKS